MNIQFLSDLHLDHQPDRGAGIYGRLDPEGVDVLVIAGDFTDPLDMRYAFKGFCDRYPAVVFVAGNHDYWKSTPSRIHKLRDQLQTMYPNLHWLRQSTVEIGGVRFAGTTLWYPKPTGETFQTRKQFVDYYFIRDFEPWVYKEHQSAVKFLQEVQADVIVTHHLPSPVCIIPKFQNSPIKHYFCHDLTRLIVEKQPPIWIFGHTHSTLQLTVPGSSTQILCNPYGYPGENKDFVPKWVVSVPPFTKGV